MQHRADPSKVWRHRAFVAFATLLIGLALSILSGWLTVWVRLPFGSPMVRGYDESIGEVWIRWSSGFGRSECTVLPPAYLDDDFTHNLGHKPAWAVRPVAGEFVTTAMTGYPFRCLRSLMADGLIRGEFTLPILGTLPYHPWWPGLILNTLFYTTLNFCIGPGRWVAIRWRRLRRGACLNCAYDRRGIPPDSPCPECGHGPT